MCIIKKKVQTHLRNKRSGTLSNSAVDHTYAGATASTSIGGAHPSAAAAPNSAQRPMASHLAYALEAEYTADNGDGHQDVWDETRTTNPLEAAEGFAPGPPEAGKPPGPPETGPENAVGSSITNPTPRSERKR